jgi:hypothetical protein
VDEDELTQAANRLAVAVVTALTDLTIDESTGEHPHARRLALMQTEAGVGDDDLMGALAHLGSRAVLSIAQLRDEPTSSWLQEWLSDPYGDGGGP